MNQSISLNKRGMLDDEEDADDDESINPIESIDCCCELLPLLFNRDSKAFENAFDSRRGIS